MSLALSSLKDLPSPVQFFVKPMLLASLLLHGLIFLMPTNSEAELPVEEVPEEEAITLTQLPPVNQPAPQATPKPTAPRPAAVPPVPRPAAPAAPRPAAPPAPRPAAPPPVQAAPRPQAAAPAPAAPTPAAPAPAAPPPAPTADQFLVDFPQYPGATPGALGLPPGFEQFSKKTQDALSAVDSWFQQQLADKGYTASPVETNPNRTVYQITRQGTTQYLTLIPNPTDVGTNILISPQQLPADLGAVQVEDPLVGQFFTELPVEQVDNDLYQRVSEPDALLSQPNAFFESAGAEDQGFYIEPPLHSGIRRAVVVRGQDAVTYSASLTQRLEIGGYQITPQAEYGGGQLLQLTRDGVTGYVSIVPTLDGTSTAVFIWTDTPQ